MTYISQLKADHEKAKALGCLWNKNVDLLLSELEAVQAQNTSLGEQNGQLRKALDHLVFLHLCEQEGLTPPTFKQWLDAVDDASKVLASITL